MQSDHNGDYTNHRPLTLVKSDGLPDWFVIEWAEHDGREWFEKTSEYRSSFRRSARVSDSDVEGTSSEMIAIAIAIENGESIYFHRCAAVHVEGSYLLSSPRNTQYEQVITMSQAKHLANEIRRVIAEAK